MIFQNLISGTNPYVIAIKSIPSFPAHMHHEIEILYCIRGNMQIKINNSTYTIDEGQAVVIGSMLSHEVTQISENNEILLIEMGPILLRDNFSVISHSKFRKRIYNIASGNSDFAVLLKDLVYEYNNKSEFSDLFITGNLYKLFGTLLRDVSRSEQTDDKSSYTNPSSKIEKAMELIYYNYADDITVDDAALACGYCKSNFCKIFKDVTGVGFHQYLNTYRVRNAEYLLSETDTTVEHIASMVGFSDSKSFCRVFKSITGTTPGQYRYSYRLL